MSSDWDPFKPVDWGASKKEGNFFEPVNFGQKEKTEYWGYSTGKEPQNFFASGNSKSESWGWSSGGDKKDSQYWGYSNNNESKNSNFWSSSSNASDAFGYSNHNELWSLKAKQDAFSKPSDWSSADTEWAYTNVNMVMNIESSISRLESKSNWAFSTNRSSSTWGWDTDSSDSGWSWSRPDEPKLKRW